MGYRLEPKVYNLKFEDHPGFELIARSVSVDELLTIMRLAGEMGEKTADEQIRDLFGRFARQITGWNLEDAEGKAIPHTLKGLLSLDDFGFVMSLITAWVEALSGTTGPTKAAGGETPRNPVEGSIPMTPAAGTP